jgi:hypothetical protein
MSKLIKLIVISSLIAVAAAIYIKLYQTTSTTINNDEPNNSNSPFNQPRATTVDDFYNKFGSKELKKDPQGDYIYKLGISAIDYNFDVDWDYKTVPFWATVNKIDESIVTLTFIHPQSLPFKDTVKDIRLRCSPAVSFLKDDVNNLNAIEINVASELNVGDNIISFCLNEECTQAGRLCKIYRPI